MKRFFLCWMYFGRWQMRRFASKVVFSCWICIRQPTERGLISLSSSAVLAQCGDEVSVTSLRWDYVIGFLSMRTPTVLIFHVCKPATRLCQLWCCRCRQCLSVCLCSAPHWGPNWSIWTSVGWISKSFTGICRSDGMNLAEFGDPHLALASLTFEALRKVSCELLEGSSPDICVAVQIKRPFSQQTE